MKNEKEEQKNEKQNKTSEVWLSFEACAQGCVSRNLLSSSAMGDVIFSEGRIGACHEKRKIQKRKSEIWRMGKKRIQTEHVRQVYPAGAVCSGKLLAYFSTHAL